MADASGPAPVPPHRVPVGAHVMYAELPYTVMAHEGYSYSESGPTDGATARVWSATAPPPGTKVEGAISACYRLAPEHGRDLYPRFPDKTTPCVPEHALRVLEADVAS